MFSIRPDSYFGDKLSIGDGQVWRPLLISTSKGAYTCMLGYPFFKEYHVVFDPYRRQFAAFQMPPVENAAGRAQLSTLLTPVLFLVLIYIVIVIFILLCRYVDEGLKETDAEEA